MLGIRIIYALINKYTKSICYVPQWSYYAFCALEATLIYSAKKSAHARIHTLLNSHVALDQCLLRVAQAAGLSVCSHISSLST